jgi:hypothetical protein
VRENTAKNITDERMKEKKKSCQKVGNGKRVNIERKINKKRIKERKENWNSRCK